MNSDRIEGAAKSAGGKLEEGLGRAAGDVKMQVEGAANQAKGAVQDAYGQVREAATTVRRQARGLEETIRENVETRPYTAVAVALALGWFVGRLGRPY
jgi:uncharacterized protein YjbJ (UPF0337 family)